MTQEELKIVVECRKAYQNEGNILEDNLSPFRAWVTQKRTKSECVVVEKWIVKYEHYLDRMMRLSKTPYYFQGFIEDAQEGYIKDIY